MSITWLSSDLGASKCYRNGDKPRPPSDMPVISSDPGPSSTSRVFICSATSILQRMRYSLFILLANRGSLPLRKKKSPRSEIVISNQISEREMKFSVHKNLPFLISFESYSPIAEIYLSHFMELIGIS